MGILNLRARLYIFLALFSIIILFNLMVMIPSMNAWSADVSPSLTFTLVSAVLKLESGAQQGEATMLLRIDGLEKTKKDYPANPDISDIGVPKPPDVTFSKIKVVQVGETSRNWLLTAEIKDLPANTSQKRYLLVQYAGVGKTLDYTLTNKYDTAFSWTLKPPPSEISIRSGQGIEIGIAVGPVPASRVRLLQATLIEESRKYPLAEAGFVICEKPTMEKVSEQCKSEINLEDHSPNRIWLHSKNGSYPVGKFKGSVTIGASQKPEGDTINLTVYSTRFWWRQFGGIIVIILGVIASWWVSTYSRYRLVRNQILFSAALFKEKFEGLKTKLGEAPSEINHDNMKETSVKLRTLLEELSEKALLSRARKLGKLWAEMIPKLDDFKAVWERMDTWVMALDELISRGMAVAWDKLKAYSSEANRINEAVRQLDELAKGDKALALEKLQPKIGEVLNKLKTELEQTVTTIPPGVSFTPGKKEIEKLEFEFEFINWISWGFWLVTTVIVGTFVVVLPNLGFGLWTDYMLCFFWGVGLPTTGTQLTGMTSLNVAAKLGISNIK